jgi:hypothetical protein
MKKRQDNAKNGPKTRFELKILQQIGYRPGDAGPRMCPSDYTGFAKLQLG